MVIRALIVFVALVAASGVIARAERSEPVPPRQSLDAFPMTINGLRGRNDPPLSDKERAILGADDYMVRTYFAPDRAVGLYVGYWESQKRGDTVHSPLNCLPGSGWEPLSHTKLAVPLPRGSAGVTPIEVNRYVIQKGLNRQLVLYWYQSHGRVVASEYWGKFYLVTDAVRYGRSDTAIVRVIAPIGSSGADAETQAERSAVEFVQQIFPLLGSYIPS
jgi:EpsI family protein